MGEMSCRLRERSVGRKAVRIRNNCPSPFHVRVRDVGKLTNHADGDSALHEHDSGNDDGKVDDDDVLQGGKHHLLSWR